MTCFRRRRKSEWVEWKLKNRKFNLGFSPCYLHPGWGLTLDAVLFSLSTHSREDFFLSLSVSFVSFSFYATHTGHTHTHTSGNSSKHNSHFDQLAKGLNRRAKVNSDSWNTSKNQRKGWNSNSLVVKRSEIHTDLVSQVNDRDLEVDVNDDEEKISRSLLFLSLTFSFFFSTLPFASQSVPVMFSASL